ncbi:phage tail tape measure protein [Rheinheimera fenheensis]|uniref:phage tail tape measure protein n=1 Tax=Rheinheimera fenheensis TaxID=3152295 RepID=UPI0032614ABB
MSSKSMGTLSVNLVANTGSFEEGTTRAQRATEKLNRAVQKQKDELQDLIGQIDPVVAEYNRLDKMEEKLRKHRDTKLIDDNDFKMYSTRIQQMRDQVGKASVEFNKNGVSAKQMQAALRNVPAQFTDIAVSLQAGQNPLTVFLQQGGQLKDMFGGIGPAAQAMGGYVLGLINPFTSAAAAAGVLALAYYQGSIEADRFRNALILTGNVSGTTVEGLTEMARRIDGVSGTQRQASAALAEIANTGKFTAEQIEMVGRAAVQMENVTGKAVADTLSEFEKLTKDPANSVAELNEKYNFLTADIYEQIKALEQQGRTQEAVSMAVKAYADAVEQRTGEITENLGYIESGWKGIKNAAAEAWDSVLGVGRSSTLSDELALLDTQIAQIESRLNNKTTGSLDLLNIGITGGRIGGGDDKELAALKQQREQLQFKLDLENSAAVMAAERAQIEKDAIKAQQAIAKVTEQSKTNDEKRAAAIKDYYANIEKIRAANPESALLNAEKISKDIKAIEEQFKQTTKEVNNTAAQQMIMRLREQEAALRGQLESEGKITSARAELLKFDQQIADIREKKILTAAEKSLLADQQSIRIQLEKNAAVEDEIKAKLELIRLSSLQQSVEADIAADALKYSDRLAAFGMGDKELEKLRERERITRDVNRELQKLQRDAMGGDISQEQFDKERDLLEESLNTRLQLHEDYYTQLEELQGDWTNGASEAFQNYIDNAADIAGQTEDIFTKAFGGLEDAVFEFVKTGQLNLRDLIAAITEDVIRMLIRVGAQKLAMLAIDKAIGTTAAAGYIASITGQATAQTAMAALNAFASTAAIPIVGPALAPAAAGAAGTIASGFAAAAIVGATGTLAGMAHSGLDYIPNEGTWLLDKGERVLSPRQNQDLTRFLGAVNQDGGRAVNSSGSMGRKVDLNFNFSAMDNSQLMEMLMENRGTIAGMVSSAFEDQGVSLWGR